MKGILFTEPNFLLTVQGIKKQTRRIIKPQPDDRGLRSTNNLFEDWHGKVFKPRYKVGEIVYLKEPYQHAIVHEMTGYGYFYGFNSIADYSCDLSWFREIPRDQASEWWKRRIKYEDKKMNKLFMPESAARYFIMITAVMAERLQDISEEDCLKEGIQKHDWNYKTNYRQPYAKSYLDGYSWTAQEEYKKLIDSINGGGTWEDNPFVWVYDYEMITKKL